MQREARSVSCHGRVLALVFLLPALLQALPGARAASAEVALGDAEARLAARFAARGVLYPPRAVTLVALKAEGRLELWAAGDDAGGWRFVRSYLVQATSGRLGPKLRQGDHQVPEGIYRVSALNPRSAYHLSLRLDYPNAFDQERASEEGRTRLGGDIMIHGDRVSDGCLPVGNEAIEELFALAERIGIENLAVLISPLDLRRVDAGAALKRVPQSPRWLASLYGDIARALAPFALAGETESTAAAELRLAKAPKCRPYDAGDCEKKCRAGDLASCTRAGVLYGEGRGVERDAAKAWTLLGDACRRGEALGCGALGELLLSDDGVRLDTSRAAKLARAACDAGDGHGCARLAQLCTDRLIYPEQPDNCSEAQVDRLRRRAVSKLSSSCRGWAAYDCFRLAQIYGPGDLDNALRFARGSCDAGDAGGCEQLALLHELRGEAERAAALYQRACDAGYRAACARRRTPTVTVRSPAGAPRS
ncbi:MAG: L,D-transpeptidase family protein, partial [Thermodesulfobacteriota bacterium]